MRILAPHKEQDHWAYVRVRLIKTARAQRWAIGNVVPGRGLGDYVAYYHDHTGHKQSRIISSKRVEEAVETMDYLKKCAEEGLCVKVCGTTVAGEKCWWVYSFNQLGPLCPTLREAYHRYHNAQ